MAIDTRDKLIAALGNAAQTFVFNKASIATQAAGGFSSLWRATGTPAQGAIPGAVAVCDDTLLGALAFTNPTAPALSYLAEANLSAGNGSMGWYLHDRLSHMGGLNGTLTTSQTVNVDTSVATSNMVARKGASDYSDVQWWIEIYTDIGTTAVTCTVTYTNAAGTAGRTTTLTVGGASPANQDSRMFPIIGSGGEFIRSVQSIQLSATTGTAGSFGVTATRKRAAMSTPAGVVPMLYDWAMLGLPKIEDDSCLFFIALCGTTTTGTLFGGATLIQG